MKVNNNVVALLLVAVFSVPCLANAAVISVDWKTTNDNLITRDSATRLDWLDLTQTINRSRYNIAAETLIEGGLFEGWTYATNSQVVTLWSNWDIDLSQGAPTSERNALSKLLVVKDMLGDTRGNGAFYLYGASGMTLDAHPLGGYQILGGSSLIIDPSAYTDLYQTVGADTFENSQGAGTGRNYFGHYLIRTSPVPVPAAIWLFGSGLLGLIGVARRKKA